MQVLSPLRAARDQAIIASCLAEAMAAGGSEFTLASLTPAERPSLMARQRRELLDRARTMRAEAANQCQLAREMRVEASGMVDAMRAPIVPPDADSQ